MAQRVKSIVLICMLAICLEGCQMLGSNLHFQIVRINSESNLSGNETDYYYAGSRAIYHYSLEDNEEEWKGFLPENEYVDDFAVWNDTIYCVTHYSVGRSEREWEIKRFEYTSGKVETVLSWDEILEIYNCEEAEKIDWVQVKVYEDNLLIRIMDSYDNIQVYSCEMDGSTKLEFADVSNLFPDENKLGVTDKIVYKGVIIERQYDAEREKYTIIQVREEESGRNIFRSIASCLCVDGKDICIWKEDDEFWYQEEGSSVAHRISCLSGSEYAKSAISEEKLTVEKGEIIGLVHVVGGYLSNPYDPGQSNLRYDVLFRLNPETGESSIIYKTENKRTRIIGYKDGVIYLLRRHRIYSQPVNGEERTLLYELPGSVDYMFDWQGDYLLVFYKHPEHKLVTALPISD